MDLNVIKAIIKSILISTKNVTTINALDRDYKSLEGHFIPYDKFRYNQLEAFLRSLTDTVEVIGYGLDAIVSPVASTKSEHIANMVKQQNFSRTRQFWSKPQYRSNNFQVKCPAYVKAGLRRQVQTAPINNTTNGKPFNKLVNNFKELSINDVKETNTTAIKKKLGCGPATTTRLNYRKIPCKASRLAASNVETLATINESSSSLSINPNVKKCETNVMEFSSDEEAIPLYAAQAVVRFFTVPEEVMHYGDKIPPAYIPENILAAAFIHVIITEVYSPFQFWFHHPNKSLKVLGHKFISDFAKFYKRLEGEKSYLIPRLLIKPGLVCAVKYENKGWHRAEILSLVDDRDIVKVYFIDYGTVDDVEYSKILYLHKDFGDYPALVMRGCLCDVDPTGPHWSLDATAFLLDNVRNKWLQAIVSEIDELNGIVFLTLYDNDPSEDITDKLVKAGFAQYNEQYWSLGTGKHRYNAREEFPTFEMLEKGLYPNLKQISSALVSGRDLETYYDTIFYNQEHIAKLRLDPLNVDFCETIANILKVPDASNS